MQEIARKDFDNLRQDSDGDSEPQPKIVHRGRPPGKHTRKSLGMSPSERVAPESSSDATLASGGDIASGSNGYNLRKGLSKFQPTDSSARASQGNSGGYTGWTPDWENEFPGQYLCLHLSFVCPIPSGFNQGQTNAFIYRNVSFNYVFCLQLLF